MSLQSSIDEREQRWTSRMGELDQREAALMDREAKLREDQATVVKRSEEIESENANAVKALALEAEDLRSQRALLEAEMRASVESRGTVAPT